jgi:hypothetical protein
MKRLIVTTAAILALGASLSACETATPYQPLHTGSAPGGYSELRIEPDRWRVSFRGNDVTPRDTVETYLLYRAADLTVSQGFDWFEPVDRHTDKKVSVEPGPGFYGGGFYGGFGYGYGWRRWGGGWGPYWGDPFFDTDVTEKFTASAEIVMGHNPKPEGDRRAMDAREVLNNLRTHVVTPTK